MELSLLGESLTGATNEEYKGYWMPAADDNATYAIDVKLNSQSGDFKVKAQTKNEEDPDSSATDLGGGSALQTITGTGVLKWEFSGAKELVRYVIVVAGEANTFLYFQFMQPQFVPN